MRPRLTVTRTLRLTVPRAYIDDNEGPADVRLGYTIRWQVPLEFLVSSDSGLSSSSPPIYRRSHPATIVGINNGFVDLSIALETRTYVRYRC